MRTRKRKASDTAQLRVWRWLNWNKQADWVCRCANANGYEVPQCPDCLMKKPAPPGKDSITSPENVTSTLRMCAGLIQSMNWGIPNATTRRITTLADAIESAANTNRNRP